MRALICQIASCISLGIAALSRPHKEPDNLLLDETEISFGQIVRGAKN